MVVDDVGSFVSAVELLALDLSERYIDAGDSPLASGALAALAASSTVLRQVSRGEPDRAAEVVAKLREMHGALRLLLAVSSAIEPDGQAGDRLDEMLIDSSRRAAAWADCVPRGGQLDRALILFASASALCMTVMRGDLPRSRALAEMVERNAGHVAESLGSAAAGCMPN